MGGVLQRLCAMICLTCQTHIDMYLYEDPSLKYIQVTSVYFKVKSKVVQVGEGLKYKYKFTSTLLDLIV